MPNMYWIFCAVFPSDLFYSIIIRDGRRVLLEGEKDIDLHLQIQKLHMMITHRLEAGICFLLWLVYWFACKWLSWLCRQWICAGADKARAKGNAGSKKELSVLRDASGNVISAQTFTFRQLAAATNNFRDECFIGEGGFGRVYKGRLDMGQVISFVVKVGFHFSCFLLLD